jgi:hypothetical protein
MQGEEDKGLFCKRSVGMEGRLYTMTDCEQL